MGQRASEFRSIRSSVSGHAVATCFTRLAFGTWRSLALRFASIPPTRQCCGLSVASTARPQLHAIAAARFVCGQLIKSCFECKGMFSGRGLDELFHVQVGVADLPMRFHFEPGAFDTSHFKDKSGEAKGRAAEYFANSRRTITTQNPMSSFCQGQGDGGQNRLKVGKPDNLERFPRNHHRIRVERDIKLRYPSAH